MRKNRQAWDAAAHKYEHETDELLEEARSVELLELELRALRPVLQQRPLTVHLQSGHGLDDVALIRAGCATVIGVDFSAVTVSAARRRANALGLPIQYVVGDVLAVPLRAECAQLIYTGQGALMWLSDLKAWAAQIARLLRRGGSLFLYEEHPSACLWTTGVDAPRIRSDRNYFGGTRVNETFPASAISRFSEEPDLKAVERQWTFGDIITSLLDAGLVLDHLQEYPQPFWRPESDAAAWRGALPNSFSLLAHKP